MENIIFSTDKSKLEVSLIIDFLHKHSYWAKEVPEETILKSIENSLCIGMYLDEKMIGFTRLVTDYCRFFYVADVFIIPELQNKGYGKKLFEYIMDIDFVKSSRGILTTQTAHKFYEQFGFSRDNDIIKSRIMIRVPD